MRTIIRHKLTFETVSEARKLTNKLLKNNYWFMYQYDANWKHHCVYVACGFSVKDLMDFCWGINYIGMKLDAEVTVVD